MMRRSRPSARGFYSHPFPETRNPTWFARWDNTSDRGASDPNAYVTPGVSRGLHQNLRHDAGPDLNPFLRNAYYSGYEEMNLLKGRRGSIDAPGAEYYYSMGKYEVSTDLRYKGHDDRMARLSYFEPHWNKVNYAASQHQQRPAFSRRTNPELQAKANQLQFRKTRTDVEAFWTTLQQLIAQHKGLGDYAPGRARSVRFVHEFFLNFFNAIDGFDHQDAYLKQHLIETRPKELDDLYAVFLDLEVQLVNPNYCPRCHLHATETHYCGEGEPFSPFRKWRGVPVPHKPWGAEWYGVYQTRAEQLWYRAKEDPHFGVSRHTQRQAENLLAIYCRTQGRAKANDFMVRLQGSAEFLDGSITITPEMQRMYDELLDTTPHPTLLTNAATVDHNVTKYLGPGAAGQPAQSAAQVRVEYELAKFRRQQREEGTVQVPPAGWSIDTKTVVPYKTEQGRVVNWRQVKASLEASIRATGLPLSAWTAAERREMQYLEWRVQNAPKVAEQLRAQLAADRAKAKGTPHVEFPDADSITVFDTRAEQLGTMKHCLPFIGLRAAFLDPTAVNATTATSTNYKLDVTDRATEQFGFTSGTVVAMTAEEGTVEVLVLGVDKSGPADKWQLIGCKLDDADDVIAMGTDLFDVRAKCKDIRLVKKNVDIPAWLAKYRTGFEEVKGVIIGARNGVVYAQFDGKSVAMPMGRLSDFGEGKLWRIKAQEGVGKLVEPFSWNVPFRNDWSAERLEELKKAPWKREASVPLTPNRYTPKVKRFGYAQHTTQDDFITKEYQDRLTSKQVFTDSQRFQHFPDATAKSVHFAGKNESTITHGVPTVDRNELENGWDEVPRVPTHEVNAIEQAIRDISGRRPGNFIKTDTEKSSLQLTESWWQSFMFGWQQREIQDRLLHPAERRTIDKKVLPWGGNTPEFGTTYGIFERYRDIAESWNRGFDIGPHGYGAHENHAHFDTLGSQSDRAALIGLNNTLVRMFDDKLRAENLTEHAFVISPYCQFNDVPGKTVSTDPKKLLMALNEWRTCGRPPTLMLATILKNFLANELAEYNQSLPASVPQLTIDCSNGVVTLANIPASVWIDRDPARAQLQYAATSAQREVQGVNEYGYICAVYLEQCCGGIAAESDASQNFRAQLAAQFYARLSELVGQGIDHQIMRNAKLARTPGGAERIDSTVPLRFVRADHLDAFLQSQGLPSDMRSRVLQGLKAEATAMLSTPNPNGEYIPADLILRWKPSTDAAAAAATAAANRAGSPKSSSGLGVPGNSTTLSSGSSSTSSGLAAPRREFTLTSMLESLAHNNDGFVMDMRYAAREDKKNAMLRRNFKALFFEGTTAFRPSEVDRAYDLHCEGRFVPSIEMVVHALPGFVASAKAAATLKPTDDSLEAQRARVAASILTVHGSSFEVHPVPTEAFPFEFENVRHSVLSTVLEYRQFGVPLGPDANEWIPLLTAKTKPPPTSQNVSSPDFCYSFDGKTEEVYFDPAALFGLEAKLKAIDISMDRAKIATAVNAVLRHCAPLSRRWIRVQNAFNGRGARDDEVGARNSAALKAVHQRDLDAKIEADFRTNAERYWRSILENAARGGNGTDVAFDRAEGSRRPSPGKAGQKPLMQFSSGSRAPSPGQRGGQQQQQQRADQQFNRAQGSSSPQRGQQQQQQQQQPRQGSPGSGGGRYQNRDSPQGRKSWKENTPPSPSTGDRGLGNRAPPAAGGVTGRSPSPGAGRGSGPR